MADDKKRDHTIELGDRQPNNTFEAAPKPAPMPSSSASTMNNPPLSILAYCGSSILMTCTNKFVLTGTFNLNFFLLAIQVRSFARGSGWNDLANGG